MELQGFYSVVSTVNFTLLGLWWLAIRERTDIGRSRAAGRRMAYVVSLQFLVPGTMSLLAQVAPDEPLLWRSVFAFAGMAGAAATLLLVAVDPHGRRTGRCGACCGGVVAPIYAIVAVIAAVPAVASAAVGMLSPLQVEASLLCVLVFLGVNVAWVVAMAPRPDEDQEVAARVVAHSASR